MGELSFIHQFVPGADARAEQLTLARDWLRARVGRAALFAPPASAAEPAP
jgi:hypothetical protein